MNVQNIEKRENNTASFQVVVDAADFEKAVNEVYRRNKKDLYIPGFRKGKAPRAVIEGMYGKEYRYLSIIVKRHTTSVYVAKIKRISNCR